MVRMDNMIINASMKLAEETIAAICRDYGVDVVRATADEFIGATEKVVRETISKWPAGTYRAERAADWDGTTDKPVWVRLTLTIKPDTGELVFDYSDSDKQVDFINSPLGNTYYATVAPLLWILPAEIPRNQGLYNCLTIIVKEGTVLAPQYPATCAAQALAVGEEIIECVLVALGQAIPKDVPALWTRHLCPALNGKNPNIIDPRTGAPQMYTVASFTSDGSSGAIYGYDGWNGIAPAPTGGAVLKPPIEITEMLAPWRWLHYEGITDSSGHGQFRGDWVPIVSI